MKRGADMLSCVRLYLGRWKKFLCLRHPSSPDFDSGVDSLSSPKFHFVWSTHINTHILPHHVISFIYPSTPIPIPSPRNPSQNPLMFNFTAFFSELSKVVSQETMTSFNESFREFQKGRKSWKQLMDFVKSSAPRDGILGIFAKCRQELEQAKAQEEARQQAKKEKEEEQLLKLRLNSWN